MNPHVRPSLSVFALTLSIWNNRRLMLQMIKREVAGRYKGSVLGLAWSLFNPLFMLGIYTLVFVVVFKARWSDTHHGQGTVDFAIVIFVGMIIHNFFSEVLNRSPTLMLANSNYVKKVVFPLEILPAVSVGAALFHALISMLVLLVAFIFVNGYVHWTTIFMPVIFAPFAVLTLGFAWILSSLGVFLRDVAQVVGFLTSVTLFLSPVFYPLGAVPAPMQPILLLNPITLVVEQMRDVALLGESPAWTALSVYVAVSLGTAWLGFVWFQKTRKGFADVL